MDPVRLLDSRTPTPEPLYPAGARTTPAFRLGAGETFDLLVAGRGVVPAVAGAVALNVTAVGATASTDVRVYPTPAGAGAVPTVSSLNVAAGTTVANLVTVTVGAGGRVRLRNAVGAVHLLADLAGYFTPAGRSSLTGRTPTRLLDT
ncbi:MAG: hypothetical protein KY410_08895, partial [Proteobacteria bacterium]|nr:hypothetical protein [Pseudomonadota bacterium]